MHRKLLIIGLWLVATSSIAQNKLTEYITIGLENNLILKERNISLEKSIVALKDARSMFLPSVDFIGNYTLAQGGRTFTFPVGDLLNPVYSTLNQLTASQNFPQVENAKTQFLPDNFYDVRFRISYPLFNKDIYYNKTIKREEILLQKHELEIYKQELVKEIKQAYFNYCSAIDAVSIYQNGLELVNRNLKVNQSLLSNGQGLPANVLRAESEQQAVYSSIIESENTRLNSKYFFNFLLNRSLSDTVIVESTDLPDSLITVLSSIPNTSGRSELRKINAGLSIYNTQLKLNQSYALPKLNTFLDLGSQAFDFEFDSQSRYYLFGVQIDIPIFNGGRNRFKIQQTKLDIEIIELQKSFVSNQLQLSAQAALNNLKSSFASFQSSQKELSSATAYFNLIDKGFNVGTNTLIEFIDARNQVTSAQIRLNINRFRVLSQSAEYERQTATYQDN